MRILAIILLAAFPAASFAAERGTPDEAKALLKKAFEHYQGAGRAKALADFNSGKPPFMDRDLYVVCIAPDRKLAANGQFPKLVGVSVDVLKDADGKPLGTAIINAGSAKGGGSVSYMMKNPVSGRTEPKVMFARQLGDDVCGVGAYTAR